MRPNTLLPRCTFLMEKKVHLDQVCCMYSMGSQLLTMSVQLNVFYYGNKQDHSNVDTLMHTHIYPIYLYDWTLNDLAYCHNKTHLIEQSFSVAGCPPCILEVKLSALEHFNDNAT